jgi:hypothetical protein
MAAVRKHRRLPSIKFFYLLHKNLNILELFSKIRKFDFHFIFLLTPSEFYFPIFFFFFCLKTGNTQVIKDISSIILLYILLLPLNYIPTTAQKKLSLWKKLYVHTSFTLSNDKTTRMCFFCKSTTCVLWQNPLALLFFWFLFFWIKNKTKNQKKAVIQFWVRSRGEVRIKIWDMKRQAHEVIKRKLMCLLLSIGWKRNQHKN